MIVYALIAVANACVWSIVVVLAGAPAARIPLFFAIILLLTFFFLLFVAGAAVRSRPPYHLDL